MLVRLGIAEVTDVPITLRLVLLVIVWHRTCGGDNGCSCCPPLGCTVELFLLFKILPIFLHESVKEGCLVFFRIAFMEVFCNLTSSKLF